MPGSIRKKGRKFYVVVYTGLENGKRKYKWSQGFDSKKEAEAYRESAAVLPLHGSGVGVYGRPGLRLKAYLLDWLDRQEKRIDRNTLRPKTYLFYHDLVTRHVIPAIGWVPISRLDPRRLERLYDDLRAKSLGPTTIHHVHRTLNKALADAVRGGIIRQNPSAQTETPKRGLRSITPLTEEQARAFLAEARKSSRHYPLYLTALATGARPGELLALTWENVQLEEARGALLVAGTLQRLPGQPWQIMAPKTERGRRAITVPAEVAAELRNLHKRQTEERLRHGLCQKDRDCQDPHCSRWHDLGFVFGQSNGRPLHEHNLAQRDFPRILKRVGLPRLSLYAFTRHGNASYLIARGVDVATLSARLGHATSAFTLTQYVHAFQSRQDEASDAIGDMLQDRRAVKR